MTLCSVCGKEVTNLRKHCTGKWHNDAEDLGHLKLALELSPGVSACLEEILREVKDGGGVGSGGGVRATGEQTDREQRVDALDRILDRILSK